MCYERSFFKRWMKRKGREREEVKPEDVRVRPDVQRTGPEPQRATTCRKEVERGVEQVV